MNSKYDIRHYAQCRANETGRPYLITDLGNVLADFPQNRKAIHDMEMVISERMLPNYSPL